MAIDLDMQDRENLTTAEDGDDVEQPKGSIKLTLQIVTVLLAVLAVPHLITGALSVVLGVILCSRAPIWLAHTISPIWSGVVIFLCGLVGLISAKRKTTYTIHSFTAGSTVALLIGIVSLQLLRLGLVDHTTSGQTFIKDELDRYVMVALISMSVACGFAIISLVVSFFVARHMKKMEKYMRRRVVTKEQMIAERQEQLRKQKDQEKKIIEKMEKEQARSTRYHRI